MFRALILNNMSGKIVSTFSPQRVLRGKDFEMLKRQILLCALAMLVASVSACIFSPEEKKPIVPPPPQQKLEDLNEREDVFNNIEVAYNKRRIDYYNGLLDANFTFFLSTGDVNDGLPVSWNRADEIDVNTKLFDPNNTVHPCQSTFMDIGDEKGISWIEIIPESAPTETWYQTTLYYDFKFEISPNTYIPITGAKAVFTVRDAGPYGEHAHHWQLVEFRDLGDQ